MANCMQSCQGSLKLRMHLFHIFKVCSGEFFILALLYLCDVMGVMQPNWNSLSVLTITVFLNFVIVGLSRLTCRRNGFLKGSASTIFGNLLWYKHIRQLEQYYMAHYKIELTGNLLNESWLFRFLKKTLTPYLAFVLLMIFSIVTSICICCLSLYV